MHKKISLYDFVPKWQDIHFQFTFSIWAIDHFKKDPEAIKEYVKVEEEKKNAILGKIESINKDESTLEDNVEMYLSRASATLEESYNAIKQNAIILHIANFESFLKYIHKHILRNNTQLLKTDRQIPLGKILYSGISALIEEEIEREAESLDRKNLLEKIKYFTDKMGISPKHLQGPILDDLQVSIRLRNLILHDSCKLKISNEQVKKAEISCLVIGLFVCYNSWLKYPSLFLFPENLKDKI